MKRVHFATFGDLAWCQRFGPRSWMMRTRLTTNPKAVTCKMCAKTSRAVRDAKVRAK